MKTITKKINGQTFIFDFRKLVYWEEKSSLILSDVHIGKITHFRKNGISLPSFPALNNLNTLKSGIYMVVIGNGFSKYSQKLVKL